MAQLRWFCALSCFYGSVLPFKTTLSVVLGVLSRISSMFSLLLPVKILLLVGSGSVPKYFPLFLREIEHVDLVIYLCMATVFFYALYVILEKISDVIERLAERLIVKKYFKILQGLNNKKTLKKSYGRIINGLTDFSFIFVVAIFIALTYSGLLLFLLAYIGILLMCFKVFGRRSEVVISEVESDEDEKEKFSVAIWVDIGFLLSFFFVVHGMLKGVGPGLVLSFVCFLLLRRSSGSVKRFIKTVVNLYSQKNKLEYLIS